MQSSNKGEEQKRSKFAAGRLKLSTSCTECHRRKQKCDQKQPCRNCSRRYPAPECTYRTVKTLTPDSELSNPFYKVGYGQIASPSRNSQSRNSPSDEVESVSTISDGSSTTLKSQPDGVLASRFGPESYDKWSPTEYQNLVGAMVAHLGDLLDPQTSLDSQGDLVRFDQAQAASNTIQSDQYTLNVANQASAGDRKRQSTAHISRPSTFSITSVDPLHFLGITPTYQSGELLHAFVKIISKYVVSIDGRTTPNYYNDVWVPWCMKSPLLAYFAIFTASCYQSEIQKIPPQKSAVVLGYKLKTIELLNAMLRNKDTSTSIEALTAVGYIITSEWYWSNYDSVKAHLKGLKEMVRLRGGLGEMGSFSRRMIILIDYQISCSYDIDLSFPHNTATHVSYPMSICTPWIYSLTSFSSIHSQLNIAPETASILDDMRFLQMNTIKHLEDHIFDNAKHISTVNWIQSRILSLPSGSDATSSLTKDNIYKSCRTASLIYIKALQTREPLSQTCSIQDLNLLWSSMWRVPLTQWKQIPGIFLWIILAGLQAAQSTPHGRFLKSMFKAAASYMSLDHFEAVDVALMNFVKMQTWLRNANDHEQRDETKPQAVDSLTYIHNYKQ